MNDLQRPYEQLPVATIDPRLERALPCPFCGSRDLEMARMANYVHCIRCGADGPEMRPPRSEETWIAAIDRWNWRRLS